MGAAGEYLRRMQERRPGREPEYVPELRPEETTPSWGSRVLSAVPDAVMGLLNALDYTGAATRAGIENVAELLGAAPIERTGRETLFGAAPAGRELLRLGTGEKGRFQAGDVPGFLVELAADPINLLGFGGLTKAGKLAKEVAGLSNVARAAAARGATDIAEEALAAIAKRTVSGPAAKWTSKLAEQAEQGLRHGLAIDIPWGPKIPISLTGGRISGRVFRGLDRAAESIGRGVEPVVRFAGAARLRPASFAGDVGAKLADELGADPAALYNAAVESGRGVEAEGRYAANWTGSLIARNLARAAREHPEDMVGALEEIKGALAPLRADMAAHFDTKIAAAVAAKDLARARGLTIQRDRQLAWLTAPTRTDPWAAANALTLLGVEKGGAVAKLSDEIAALTGEADALTAAWRKTQAAVEEVRSLGFDPPEPLFAQAAKEEAGIRKLAEKIHRKTIHREASEIVLRTLPEPVRREVDRIAAALGESFAGDQIAGVKYGALIDGMIGYAPRRMDRAAEKWAATLPEDSIFRKVIKEYQTTGRFVMERTPELRGLAIPQVNDLARAHGFKGDLFSENVAESVTRRLLEGAKARGGASTAVGALTLFALPESLAGPGAVPVAKLLDQLRLGQIGGQRVTKSGVEAITKELKGTAFENAFIPQAVAEGLTRVYRIVEQPGSLSQLGRVIEGFNAAYRLGVTQMFPAFHARNELSNWFMMFLAGMRNPVYIGKAAGLQMRVRNAWLREAGETLRTGAKVADAADLKLMREAARDAALGQTLAGETRELLHMAAPGGPAAMDPVRRTLAGIAAPATGPLKKVAAAGIAAGTALEDNSKLALYLWARDKGMTSQEAGQLVKKWLFDYGDLTHLEKRPGGIRSLAYFYTYMRKAVPLMFREMMLQPRKLRAYAMGAGAIGSRAQGRELLPAWMQETLPIGTGTDEQGHPTYLSLGLPVEQLTQFGTEGKGPKRTLQKIAAQLAPIPRLAFEYLADSDLRTGRKKLREDPVVLAAAGLLPGPLRREVHGLARLAPLLPASRLSGALGSVLDVSGLGRRPAAAADTALRLGLGANLQRVPIERAKLRTRLDALEAALVRLEEMGLGESQRARELRTLRGRSRRALQNVVD